jgi:AraC family transcriptional regulator
MRGLLIEVPATLLARLQPVSIALEQVQHLSGGPATWFTARLHKEFAAPDAASPLAVEALTVELLVEVARRSMVGSRRPPAWMARAIDVLHSRFQERLDLTTLASIAGVHPVHFAREFRRHHRCTPGDYVRSLRVDSAARALSGTDAPLVEIATAAGFADQSHFCRVFKRHLGMSPSEFRRAHRSR